MAGIDLQPGTAILVAWRTTAHAYGRVMNVGGAVGTQLRQWAAECAQTLDTSAPEYDPDDLPEEGEQRVAARAEAYDTELLAVLNRGSSNDTVTDEELGKHLDCWAVATGTGDNSAVFVRRRSPILLANKPLVAGLFDHTLTKIESKIFGFEKNFDLVITKDRLFILNQSNFEALFKESKAVLAQVGAWADELIDKLPVASGSKDVLTALLERNSSARRKVSSILRRDYLPKVTSDAVRAALESHGMAPDLYLAGDEIVFTADNAQDLIRFLNEDLFTGDFSGDRFAAAAKTRVTSA